MKDKKEFRSHVLKIRNSMTQGQVSEKSKRIIEKLVSTEDYKNSATVFIYMSFKNEVETMDLIKRMLAENKQVVIPYTDVENTVIIPSEIKNVENDLKMSSFGYLEPVKEKIVPVNPEKFDLIIVPGVVFDKRLNRIGFGKGYYDRILEHKRKDAKAIALAYTFQVYDEIPFESHDIKMDAIITEEAE